MREEFAERAAASGGKLFGCWRSMVGLGLARDEGIAVTSWPTEELARGVPAVDGAEHYVLETTVRPKTDLEPELHGVSVFRWFDVPAADWEAFRDISDAAWPNMEEVFDVNICGFWRSLDVMPPESRTLLLTRYADLSVWEASRWWNNPGRAARSSMSRFQARNDMIQSTIAFPTLQIPASTLPTPEQFHTSRSL
ncbi:MAG: hypothetical protein ACR2PF_15255 [Rhizobiaceae bacterium]